MWKQILKTTLLAGSLDIVAACLQSYLLRGTAPATVLKYIASGIWGKAAFSGSTPMALAGLLFHFIIAFACTALFFIIYPKLKWLHRSIALNSFLIALAAWVATTRIIIPLSSITAGPFNVKNAAMALGILFICIGLPIAVAAAGYYKKSNSNNQQ